MRKGRSFLYMVVSDELKVTALREHCSFIVDRAIFETEEQAGGNPIAADELEEVTRRKHAALFRTQCEKAVFSSFYISNGYSLRWRTELQGTDQHGDE